MLYRVTRISRAVYYYFVCLGDEKQQFNPARNYKGRAAQGRQAQAAQGVTWALVSHVSRVTVVLQHC